MENSNKKNNDTINKIKKLTKPIFEQYDVEKAYIFGSYARGDYNENSDIDIIIVAKNIRSLLVIGAILEALKQALNKEVDLIEVLKANKTKKQPFEVTQDEDGVFVVDGSIVDGVLAKYVITHDEESVITFLHMLRNLGLEEALKEAGVEDGDTVRIADTEFDFVE